MKPKKQWKVIESTDKNFAYPLEYDTVYESQQPFIKQYINKYLNPVHQIKKRILLNTPEFAETDSLHFVLEYSRKNLRKKLNERNVKYNNKPLSFLPLRKQNEDFYKNNAYYDKNSIAYNGSPANDIYPNFSSVIAHEKAHQLDDVLSIESNDDFLRALNIPDKKFSFTYDPFIENNSRIYSAKRFGFDDTANRITNDDATAYMNGLHDAYPNEMFADLIADKYIMNLLGIYNSLGNTPFKKSHLKSYQKYLKENGNVGGRNRLMHNLVNPYDESGGRIPSDEIYINAMNDL